MSEYLIKNKSSVVNSSDIKKIRKDNGLTQKKFAKSIDVSLASIQKWESGERNPSKQMLFFIKNKYNVETVEEEIKNQKLMLKIKQLRRNNNESQTALSKVIGVSIRTIQNWEYGKVDVPSKKLELIAQYYGVTVAYLLKEEEEEEEEEEDLKLMFMIKLYKEQKKTNELLSKLLKK